MMNTKIFFGTLAAALLLALPHQIFAAIDQVTVQKLVAADGTGHEKVGAFQQPAGTIGMGMPLELPKFGISVALSKDTAIIGAPHDHEKGKSAGAAYIFTRTADGRWSQQAKLTAAAADAYDWFGTSVSLSTDGNTALIGAWGDDDMGEQTGAAYIFTRTADKSWTQTAKLTVAVGELGQKFGRNLYLSGDGHTALCAKPPHEVHVFNRAADGRWSQQAKLTIPDDSVSDIMSSLTLSANGSTALIGAYSIAEESLIIGNIYHPGSVYVFRRTADGRWSQQAKLAAADGARDNDFGNAVSLSADGSKALIGARGDKGNKGAAYVFSRAADGRWSQQAKLAAADINAGDSFGSSASLSADGGTALIIRNNSNTSKGSFYLFMGTGSSWIQQNNLVSNDSVISASLSPDGGTVLIGSHEAAYVFTGFTKPNR